jgi:hypothetical protein
MPLVFSVYDSFRSATSQSCNQGAVSDQGLPKTSYDRTRRWYLESKFKYIPPALLVSLGCHLASGLWYGASSTYICPLVVGQTRTVPFMQFFAAALDCYLAIVAYELCFQKPTSGDKNGAHLPLAWGSILSVRILTKMTRSSHADILCCRQRQGYGPFSAFLSF